VLGFRNKVLGEGKIGVDLGVEFKGEKTTTQFGVGIG
jgi:hypothetical protein